MHDQHTKITGYRDLNQQEIDLMNEIKEVSIKVGQLVSKVEGFSFLSGNQDQIPEQGGELIESDKRWANIAKTDLQKGFMALTRAIAKPTTF